MHASARSASNIRAFSLYGESSHLPDVVHCETIAARSALHDWELSAHRHPRLHQVLVVRRGGGTVWLDGEALPLKPRVIVNVPIGTVHAFAFQSDTQGVVITLADELLDELLARVGDTRRVLARAIVTPSFKLIERVADDLTEVFAARRAARALVLRGLSATLLGLTARAIEEQVGATAEGREMDRSDKPASSLMRRFDALLELHHPARWSVSDYARALAITPTHLSRLARDATGMPASRLIDERLMREARSQLAYTRLHIKTVADTLGFADPAHFTRVFTRVVGLSPRRYRERLVNQAPGAQVA